LTLARFKELEKIFSTRYSNCSRGSVYEQCLEHDRPCGKLWCTLHVLAEHVVDHLGGTYAVDGASVVIPLACRSVIERTRKNAAY
jgi:hypothetical protein